MEKDSKVMRQLRSLHLVKNPVVLLDLRQNAEDLCTRLQGDLASRETQKAATDDRLVILALKREISGIQDQIGRINTGLKGIAKRTEEIDAPKKAEPAK